MSETEHCDVLIVGGGPAGSSCAWRLRSRGLRVVVLDKARFPRDKTCAGWVTPAVIDTLQIDLDDYRRRNVLQPITGFAVALDRRQPVINHYDKPISYGIRRCEFDHYLLQRCGADVRQQVALKDLRREGERWIVNDTWSAPMLVGAGGHFCPVVRALEAKQPDSETVVAAKEAEFEMTDAQMRQCAVEPQVPELYFCRDLKGYGWCFRKENVLNIGLGREDKHHLSEHLQAFCDDLKKRGRIPADLQTRFKGHAYLLYGHTPRRLVDEGAVLIGDAAGLAYRQSGEGIRPAIESGLLAADAIVKAGGCYTASALRSYEKAIEQRFGTREGSNTHPSGGQIASRVKQWLAGLLLRSRWFNRNVVIDRWFLHRHQPLLP